MVGGGRLSVTDPVMGYTADAAAGAPLDGLVTSTAPARAHGLRFTLDQRVLTAAPEDGRGPTRWTFQGDGHPVTAPVVVGRVLYVGSRRGRIFAVDVDTGRRLWSGAAAVPAPPTDTQASPILGLTAAEGLLLAATTDGLVALEPRTAEPDPDAGPPDTAIDAPAQTLRERDATVRVTSTHDPSAFECRLDGADWLPCSAEHHLTGLADGEHTILARAIDGADLADPTPARATVRVDAAPDTGIEDELEGGAWPTATPAFTLTSDDAAATFACRVDGGAWSPCAAEEHRLDALAEGAHTLEARATDRGGATDATPALVRFIVDTVAPAAPRVVDGPAPLSAERRPSFAGTAGTAPGDEDRVALRVERLEADGTGERVRAGATRDAQGRWAARLTAPLRDGTYVATVIQADHAGNRTESEVTFTVGDALDTLLVAPYPSGRTTSRSVHLEFTSWTPRVSFECRLDELEWTPCLPGQGYHDLSAERHEIAVRAVAPDGTRDPTPATATWTVEAPPAGPWRQPTFDTPAEGATVTTPTPVVGGTADDRPGAPATFSVSVSSTEPGRRLSRTARATRTGATWSAQLPPLPDGEYRLSAGGGTYNWGDVRTFRVAATSVETTIVSGPEPLTRAPDAEFELSSTAAVPTFSCRLDAGPWRACASPHLELGVLHGRHVLEVVSAFALARDETPARYEWEVDTVAPALAIDTPADGTSTADATPRITGRAGSAANDRPYVNVGVVDARGRLVRPFELTTTGAWTAQVEEPLPPGAYRIVARQRDRAGEEGNLAFVSRAFEVIAPAAGDPPETQLDELPRDTIDDAGTRAVFSSPTAERFSCRVDDGAWEPCASPLALPTAADGEHVVRVRATDDAGRTDPSPAVATWRVDAAAPDLTVDAPADGATVPDRTPVAQGRAGVAVGDALTVELQVLDADGDEVRRVTGSVAGGRWSAEVAPAPAPGAYRLRAAQTDEAGHRGIAEAAVTVGDRPSPPETTITRGPEAVTGTSAVELAFTADRPDATFRCRLDGSDWNVCRSPWTTSTSSGDHVFEVRARDGLRQDEAEPARYTWTTDLIRPDVTVTRPAHDDRTRDTTPLIEGTADTGPRDERTVSVRLSGTDTGTQLELRAQGGDDGRWQVRPAEPLPADHWYVKAEQRDAFGRVGEARRWFFVDTEPETTIATSVVPATGSPAATFVLGPSDAYEFRCRLDGGAWTACDRQVTYDGLAEGPHTFEAVAADTLGADPTPEAVRWRVDRVAPVPAFDGDVAAAAAGPDGAARLSGRGGVAEGDVASVAVVVESAAGEVVRSAAAEVRDGRWAIVVDPPLPPGTYTATASQRDDAGNEGFSEPLTFAVGAAPAGPTQPSEPSQPSGPSGPTGDAVGDGGGGGGVRQATPATPPAAGGAQATPPTTAPSRAEPDAPATRWLTLPASTRGAAGALAAELRRTGLAKLPALRYRAPRAGTLRVEVRLAGGGRRIAVGTQRFTKAATARVRLARTAAAKRLRGRRAVEVVVTFRPASGAATTARRRATVPFG